MVVAVSAVAAIPAMVVIPTVVVVTTMTAVSRAAMTITATVVPIPLITSPIAAAVIVTIAIPADHNLWLHIHRRRLIDDRRRRWRIVRLRRDVHRRGNTDVDPYPHLGVGKAGYRREAQTGNASQDPDAF